MKQKMEPIFTVYSRDFNTGKYLIEKVYYYRESKEWVTKQQSIIAQEYEIINDITNKISGDYDNSWKTVDYYQNDTLCVIKLDDSSIIQIDNTSILNAIFKQLKRETKIDKVLISIVSIAILFGVGTLGIAIKDSIKQRQESDLFDQPREINIKEAFESVREYGSDDYYVGLTKGLNDYDISIYEQETSKVYIK